MVFYPVSFQQAVWLGFCTTYYQDNVDMIFVIVADGLIPNQQKMLLELNVVYIIVILISREKLKYSSIMTHSTFSQLLTIDAPYLLPVRIGMGCVISWKCDLWSTLVMTILHAISWFFSYHVIMGLMVLWSLKSISQMIYEHITEMN